MTIADYVLDEVVFDEALASAETLGRAWGWPVEEHAGRQAVKVDLDAGPKQLELPLSKNDFSHLDQFAFLVAGAQPFRLSLKIECSSQTSGLPHTDSFRSGPPQPISASEWTEAIFPFENFLIYGMPSGVKDVRSLKLNILERAGPIWISAWSGAKRKRAVGSRMTDQGLLNALDLEQPGWGKIQAELKPKRVDTALAALMQHLVNRETPKHIFGRELEGPVSANLNEAERICVNHIDGFDVGTPVNWRANPNGYLEWMHAFNRTFFFNILLRAYQKTKLSKYAEKLDALMLSWIQANPEPVNHNGGGDPAWETLSTAVRIYGSWLEVFFSLRHESRLQQRTRVEMLKSFHGHAEHLMANQGYGNNWLIVESRVLAMLGMLFPEFKRSKAWAKEGWRRLKNEIERQVYPDGADWELAPGYHMMAISGFLDVYEMARLNGLSVPPLMSQRLPGAIEYIAGMMRPDGTLPSVNDSGGYKTQSGADFLARGARLFERPDFQASTEGPYAGLSRSFPDAGMHVLAGGTGADARWLLFNAGPFGASHQHEDALSIECFAFGQPFIVDPGISGYMDDHWTQFYRETRAHSTVLVNGAGQNRRALPRSQWSESRRGRGTAVFGPVMDVVKSEYLDGYRDQGGGILHRRMVVFVREEYYLIFDEVLGEAATSIEPLFHFSPLRVELEARTRRARSMRLKGPNLEIIPLAPRQGLKVSLICGACDPVQGWVAHEGEDFPAPVVKYQLKGRSPLRFAALLCPYREGLDAGIRVTHLPKMPIDVFGVKLSFRDGRQDRVVLRYGPEQRLPRSKGQAPIDADFLVERFGNNGKLGTAAWVQGQTMTVEA